jgi:outer membrane lipoprotein-sorting protein
MSDRHDKPASDVLDRAIDALGERPIPEGPPPQLAASMVEALCSAASSPDAVRPSTRRRLMSRMVPYGAVAVALLLLVLLGYFWFTGESAGIAFADVIENVKNAQSVTFMFHQQIGDPPALSLKWYMQGDVARAEIPGHTQVVLDLKGKRQIQLMPAEKRAWVSELDDDALRTDRKEDRQIARLFRNPMDYFRQLTGDDGERIGVDELDGAEVDVFRLKRFWGIEMPEQDDENNITAWVDRRSGLPVKIALRGSFDAEGKSKDWLLLEDFEWNQPLDPELFSTEIPEGYTVAEQPDHPEPPGSEEDALAALADALEAAKKSKSVTCRVQSGGGRGPWVQANLYVKEDAARWEIEDMGIYIEDLSRRKAIHLLPASKRAHRWDLDPEHPTQMSRRFPNPLVLLGIINSEDAQWHGPAWTEGGERWHYRVKKVDLQPVLGGRDDVLDAEVCVMVDPQTRLPAEVSLHWTTAGEPPTKAWSSADNLQWNRRLDPGLFQLDVPEGYAVIEGEPTAEALAAEEEASRPPEVEIDFAQVIQNVNQAESVACTVDSTAEGSHGITSFLHFQGDLARRETPTIFIQIEDLQQGKAVQLHPSAEQAYRWDLTENDVPYARKRFPNPTLLFGNMKSDQAERTQFGRRRKQNVVVFRLEQVDLEAVLGKLDEPLDAELYVSVDPETLLPADISLNCRSPGDDQSKASFRWEEFDWNQPIDPDLFKLHIPRSYKVIEGPPPTERLGPDLKELIGARRPPGI